MTADLRLYGYNCNSNILHVAREASTRNILVFLLECKTEGGVTVCKTALE